MSLIPSHTATATRWQTLARENRLCCSEESRRKMLAVSAVIATIVLTISLTILSLHEAFPSSIHLSRHDKTGLLITILFSFATASYGHMRHFVLQEVHNRDYIEPFTIVGHDT